MTIKTLGVISVATNIYLEYWKSQARSVAKNIGPNLDVTLHIFTDQPEEAERFGSELENVKVVGHRIPAYRWPEATLYRYRIFNSAKDELTQDVLMYLDADMIVHTPLHANDFQTQSGSGVTLVRHPGYYRPSFLRRIRLYVSTPKFALGDLYSVARTGGIGAWETNPKSEAFVPKNLRKQYFCGGTWWGYRNEFLELVAELDRHVTQDEKAGVMAKWHDESHINWWGANHEHETKDPRYCYSVSYKWLSDLPMIIQAVDKDEATR
jgi:hypothetical protein